jgi:hypothetical protein
MPTVFLSYRHENSTHRDRVRQLALRLRASGLEVVLDQLANEEQFHRGGPPEGWGRWSMSQAADADRVLIVASASWFRCFRKEEKAGAGLGAAAEAGVIQQRLYTAGGKNRDIRVVFFDPADLEKLPHELGDYHRFHAAEDFTDLVAWLKGSAAPPQVTEKPESGTFSWKRFISEDLGELRVSLSKSRSRILLTTIGAEGGSKSAVDAALDSVKKDLEGRGLEVEVGDMLSIRCRFSRFDLQRFEYLAVIVLVGSDLGVETTKERIAGFRRDLAKRGPWIEIFNFSNFPLHTALTSTTAVENVDDLLKQVRLKLRLD